ncbi:hypothetical protein Pint_21484 [Pistacia integerrima]|uniref:Uncharacterized protein n=1 Tax=Pistacia integerrima TaxID=434235 RepID=A0ACC0X862_9ROSI|nr:hypothetical protein Pint_21484 [Pistacia integerrima]
MSTSLFWLCDVHKPTIKVISHSFSITFKSGNCRVLDLGGSCWHKGGIPIDGYCK